MNREQTGVRTLFVFEGVVNIAVFVPISLGDPQHEFSTDGVRHVVDRRAFGGTVFGCHPVRSLCLQAVEANATGVDPVNEADIS
jgi:hypothetical protein